MLWRADLESGLPADTERCCQPGTPTTAAAAVPPPLLPPLAAAAWLVRTGLATGRAYRLLPEVRRTRGVEDGSGPATVLEGWRMGLWPAEQVQAGRGGHQPEGVMWQQLAVARCRTVPAEKLKTLNKHQHTRVSRHHALL